MPAGAQEKWNEAGSTWSKGHPCLGEHVGDHSLERRTVSAQGAWLEGKVNQPRLHNGISQLHATIPSWHGEPNQSNTAGASVPSGVGGNSSSSASASGLSGKCL